MARQKLWIKRSALFLAVFVIVAFLDVERVALSFPGSPALSPQGLERVIVIPNIWKSPLERSVDGLFQVESLTPTECANLQLSLSTRQVDRLSAVRNIFWIDIPKKAAKRLERRHLSPLDRMNWLQPLLRSQTSAPAFLDQELVLDEREITIEDSDAYVDLRRVAGFVNQSLRNLPFRSRADQKWAEAKFQSLLSNYQITEDAIWKRRKSWSPRTTKKVLYAGFKHGYFLRAYEVKNSFRLYHGFDRYSLAERSVIQAKMLESKITTVLLSPTETISNTWERFFAATNIEIVRAPFNRCTNIDPEAAVKWLANVYFPDRT